MLTRSSPLENPFAPEKRRSSDDAKFVGDVLGKDAEAAMRRTVADKSEGADKADKQDGLTLTPEEQAQLEKNQKGRHERERLEAERRAQAQTLFDKGWGEAQGFKTFEDYLATIPEAPPKPEQWKDRFDRLVLVDGRIGLTEACKLALLTLDGAFGPYDPAKAKSGVRWMYCHDGRRNNDRKVNNCRADFLKAKDEAGLSVIEGLSLYIHDPTVIDGHVVVFPSSVHSANRSYCATLGHQSDGPGISSVLGDNANPNYGAASRGEFSALAGNS